MNINSKAESIKDELITIRRRIHANPEASLQEKETAAFVAEKLKELGIEVTEGIGVTGVMGLLKGNKPGKTILMRADMDALEMDELNDLEYKSKKPGLMHACGHDVHTTWLLGAAMILSELRSEINGNIKFIFQPAEELYGGAERMISEGILEDPCVDIAIGAHVDPLLEKGKIGIKYGSMCAAPDHFKIVIYGKGGHCSLPHNCVDPISVGVQVYTSIQHIISRKKDPLEPILISIGRACGGTANNVIPETFELEGTVRTFTHESRNKMPELMESLIKGITTANGATYEFIYKHVYPPVINDDKTTMLLEKSAIEFYGKENVVKLERPNMTGEDFSYFQQHVPGTYFYVGSYNPEKGIDKPLHSPYFNVDEDIIHMTSAFLAKNALKLLKEIN